MNNGKITRKPKSSNNGDSNALDQDGESNEEMVVLWIHYYRG